MSSSETLAGRRQTDGRSARRQRTRSTILEAHAQLMVDGEYDPTAARIAECAGVSVRTLWTVFGDMEGLFKATTEYWFARDDQLRHEIGLDAPLAERMTEFCAERVRRLESIAPAARGAGMYEYRSATLRESRLRYLRKFAADVEQAFRPEIVAAGDDGPELRNALLAVTSWNAWSVLRSDFGCSVAEAGAAMERGVRALLADFMPPAPTADAR